MRTSDKDREAMYMAGELEVVAIPRAWVETHDWPASFAEALALTTDAATGATRQQRTRQALIIEGYQVPPSNQSYVRQGDRGDALLYVQAWTGAV